MAAIGICPECNGTGAHYSYYRQFGTERYPLYPDSKGRAYQPLNMTDVRPVLRDFAVAMEAKLRKNDHKNGWRNLPIEALFKLLMIELEEFKVAHEFFGANEARKELIDIANFCMMLHDRLGMEEDKNSGATK